MFGVESMEMYVEGYIYCCNKITTKGNIENIKVEKWKKTKPAEISETDINFL